MRDANIPLYIPGISLGWRVLVGNLGVNVIVTARRKLMLGSGRWWFTDSAFSIYPAKEVLKEVITKKGY
jgi:hypothetical protein